MGKRSGLVKLVAGFAAAFAALPLFLTHPGPGEIVPRLVDAVRQRFEGPDHSLLANLFSNAFSEMLWRLMHWYPLFVGAAMLLTAAGLLARAVAQLRVRSGQRDPLDALRERPWIVGVATWVPSLFLLGQFGRSTVAWLTSGEWIWENHSLEIIGSAIGTLAIAAGLQLVSRAGARALVSPLPVQAGVPAAPKTTGDIVVSAVAVTTRSRVALGVMATASLAMVAWLATMPITALSSDPRVLAAIAAYVAAAAAGAYALRRASRIAVGIDGVWVRDTSRARFFAYRELDGVRAAGADLELLRGGRAVVRLQLHGEDAGRRDEVLTRVREGIERATDPPTRGAELLVRAMSSRHTADGAGGAASYRLPSASREQLWELVETSTTDADTRMAAAGALVERLDGPERARLRVVASRCAEPRLRVAMTALAGEEHVEAEVDEAIAPRARGLG